MPLLKTTFLRILTFKIVLMRKKKRADEDCQSSQKCFSQSLYCRWCILLDKMTGLDLTKLPKLSECHFCDGPAFVRDFGICEFCYGHYDEELYVMRYGNYELRHRDQHEMAKEIVVVCQK